MAPPVCVHTLKTMCSNLKDMARRAAPRLEQRSKQSLLCAADRRRMAPPVCVHTLKTMCSNLKDMARRDATRRGAAHPVCEPLYSGVGFIFCFSVNKLTKLCSLNKLTGHSFVLCL